MEVLEASCEYVHAKNLSAQCDFIKNTAECHGDEAFIPYITVIYCTFGSGNVAPSLVLLVLWLLVLFVGLGITADDFLTPALIIISKSLRLSQNIAGVTFLAFGNGAPDIISSLAGVEQTRPDLVVGGLFGGGCFVTCIVAGSICLTQNFKIMERPFLRDILFYIAATYWAFFVYYQREITLFHSVGFIVLYVVYIIVVVVSRVIYKRYRDRDEQKQPFVSPNPALGDQPEIPEDNPELLPVVLRRSSFRAQSFRSSSMRRRRSLSAASRRQTRASTDINGAAVTGSFIASINGNGSPENNNVNNETSTNLNDSRVCSLNSLASASRESSMESASITNFDEKPLAEWQEFLLHVSPFDAADWVEMSWFSRAFDVLKSPLFFLLAITIPVIDEENDKKNWCRMLNSLHCITSPMFILLVTDSASIMLGQIPAAVLVLMVGFALALLVFFTSKPDRPPPYHVLFGYVGFFVSVFWIFGLANEVVSLLRAVGIVFKASDAILGMTVLAWGNSIGDFMSNLAVARQGYPRMAISACFGGPLLNLLLGIGIPYTFKFLSEGIDVIEMDYNKTIAVLYATLTQSLVSTLVVMVILRFYVKRAFGYYLIGLYTVFVITAFLTEWSVIKL